MKIIVRDEQGIRRCLVQVRDIKYLAEKLNSPKFLRLALGDAINPKIKGEDFIEINSVAIAKIIEENPYIVDFQEMAKYDDLTLSRMILLTRSPVSFDEAKKRDEEHKVEDLVDLISFNKGMLTYSIPVIFDQKVLSDNGEVIFGSTTIPDHFMLKRCSEDIDLPTYFSQNAQALFEQTGIEGEMVDYKTLELSGSLIVYFNVKKKLLSKIRKRITG